MKNNKVINLLLEFLQVLFVYFGVYSSMMCMADSFSLSYNEIAMMAVMLVSAFLFYAMFSVLETIKRGKTYGVIGIIAFYLIIVWRFHEVLKKGAIIIINAYLKEFMNYTHNTMVLLSNQSASDASISQSYATTFIILFTGTFIIALISSFFYRKRRAVIFIMSTIFFFVIPVSVGKMGDLNHVAMYIIVLMIVMATRFLPHDFTDKWMRQKLSLIVMMVGMVTILVIQIFVPMKKYEDNISRIEQFKNSLTSMASWDKQDVMTFIREYFGGDVLDYGKIGKKNAINQTGKTLMRVSGKFSPDQGIYMKGYVGGEYSENKWHKVTDVDENYDKIRKTLAKDGLSVDGWHNTLRNQVGDSQQSGNEELWNVSVLKFKNLAFGYGNYVVPYYPTSPFEVDGGKVMAKEKGVEYRQEYFPQLNKMFRNGLATSKYDIASGEYWENSKNIRTRLKDFVDTYYLTVPEELNDLCIEYKKYLESNGQLLTKFQGGTCKMYDVIKATINYIFANTTYTLEPGRTPDDKDAIVYFLKENKKGYCIHYATAAAVLLRSIGVPTRYVEGIYIPKDKVNKAISEGTDINVTDEDLHAWIEVFQENYGFVPVEVTPGRGDDELSELNNGDGKNDSDKSSEKGKSKSDKKGDSEKGTDSGLAKNENGNDGEGAGGTPVPEDDMVFENIKTKNYNHEDMYESMKAETPGTESGGMDSDGGNAKNNENAVKNTENTSILNKGWFVALCVAIGSLLFLIIVIILQGRIRHKLFDKKLKSIHMKKRIMMCYKHMEPLLNREDLGYKGQSMDEYATQLSEAFSVDKKYAFDFVKLVYSASFSKNEYAKSEKVAFKNSYKKIRKAIYNNEGFIGKMYCKYVICL